MVLGLWRILSCSLYVARGRGLIPIIYLRPLTGQCCRQSICSLCFFLLALYAICSSCDFFTKVSCQGLCWKRNSSLLFWSFPAVMLAGMKEGLVSLVTLIPPRCRFLKVKRLSATVQCRPCRAEGNAPRNPSPLSRGAISTGIGDVLSRGKPFSVQWREVPDWQELSHLGLLAPGAIWWCSELSFEILASSERP